MKGHPRYSVHPRTVPVTCVITSYNNKKTIRAAVSSVLRQTMPVAEIIVADDCSTDGSQELLLDFVGSFDEIRLILRPRNVGIAANRDLALREAASPFITHLDGDDLFGPRKVEKEWEALSGSEQDIAYSYVARIHVAQPWRSVVCDPGPTLSGDIDEVLTKLLMRQSTIPRDMLLSKEKFISAGGFQHTIKLYEDWDFKIRLANTGGSWRHSGALGTLYFQRQGSLSKAERVEHITSLEHILKNNSTLLLRRLGPDVLQQAMISIFGSDLNKSKRNIVDYDIMPTRGVRETALRKYPKDDLHEKIRMRMRVLRFSHEIFNTWAFGLFNRRLR